MCAALFPLSDLCRHQVLLNHMYLPTTIFWWDQRILRLQRGFVLSGSADCVAANN